MKRLQRLSSKREKLVIGLMSGTSADGIDAALVRITGSGLETKLEPMIHRSYPYPPGLRRAILEASLPPAGTVDTICRLNFLLGELFARAALDLAGEAGIAMTEVDLIGSHGQTVHHLPRPEDFFGYPVRATLQIAEPAVIAKRTGVVTVADFRPADIAVGGSGAPLIPYFDYLIFHSEEKSRVVLNLGGIANLTVLKKAGRLEEVIAFDTGPGNMIIDGVADRLFGHSYDRDGSIASQGKISRPLLEKVLSHPYFAMGPPKSTGREEFGGVFLQNFVEQSRKLGLDNEDVVATATAIVAETVWGSCQKFVVPTCPLEEVIVSGGGANNTALMKFLNERFNEIPVTTSSEYGIPADAKEAICFAVLANETISGNPSNCPGATGAEKPTILGKICL